MLYLFAGIAVLMTYCMFHTKSMMLGFPAAIFWALLSGHAYTLSIAIWDIEYMLFFGAMGMAIFSMFAAYGLRTKKEDTADGDEFIDEGKDDIRFIDEKSNSGTVKTDDVTEPDQPSRHVQSVRDRAAKRRAQGTKRKTNWGEFK